jgi:hypothetical protein
MPPGEPRHSDSWTFDERIAQRSGRSPDTERTPWIAIVIFFALLFGLILFFVQSQKHVEPIEPQQYPFAR